MISLSRFANAILTLPIILVWLIGCATEAERQKEARVQQERARRTEQVRPLLPNVRLGMSVDEVRELGISTFCPEGATCTDAFLGAGNCRASFFRGHLREIGCPPK